MCAYSTLGLLATGSLKVASILGSIAASIECEIDGNIPVKKQDMLKKIDWYEKLLKVNEKIS